MQKLKSFNTSPQLRPTVGNQLKLALCSARALQSPWRRLMKQGPLAGWACIEECMRYTKRTAQKKIPTTKPPQKRFKKNAATYTATTSDEESKSDITIPLPSSSPIISLSPPRLPQCHLCPTIPMQKAVLSSYDQSLTSVSSLLSFSFSIFTTS